VETPVDNWANFILLLSLVHKEKVRDIVKGIRSSVPALKTSRLFFQSHIMLQHQVWEEHLAFLTLFVVVITTNLLELLM
jgi:hypothetical protein